MESQRFMGTQWEDESECDGETTTTDEEGRQRRGEADEEDGECRGTSQDGNGPQERGFSEDEAEDGESPGPLEEVVPERRSKRKRTSTPAAQAAIAAGDQKAARKQSRAAPKRNRGRPPRVESTPAPAAAGAARAATAPAAPVKCAPATFFVAARSWCKDRVPKSGPLQGALALDGPVRGNQLSAVAWPHITFQDLYAGLCKEAEDLIPGCDTNGAELMWCGRTTHGKMKAADGERFPLQSLRHLFDAMKASGRVLKTGNAPLKPSRKDQNGLFFALQLTPENNTQQKRNARLRRSNDPAAGSPSRSQRPRSSRGAASHADEMPIVYVVKTSLRGPLMVADGEITTVMFDNKASLLTVASTLRRVPSPENIS